VEYNCQLAASAIDIKITATNIIVVIFILLSPEKIIVIDSNQNYTPTH
jgi:hypothetical protein